jgi:hypothetical protein
VLQDVSEVSLVETLGRLVVSLHVLQQLVEDLQTCIRDIPHGVLERPDDGVQYQLELSWRDVEERGEAMVVHRLITIINML